MLKRRVSLEVGARGLGAADQKLFYVPGAPHPTSGHWKPQHPFHGRLTSNMVCKHCEHQVNSVPGLSVCS